MILQKKVVTSKVSDIDLQKKGIKYDKEQYIFNYDDLPRFSSYFYQIDWVRKLNPREVLEIGVGNKTVFNYLKNFCNITSVDLDGRLNPDYVSDVRKLPLKDNSFDLVICSQVLEHIPFKDIERALFELNRVSRRYIILSVPYSSLRLNLVFRIQDKILNLLFRIPLFFFKHRPTDEHYWELGRKHYSKVRFKKILSKHKLKILKEESPILNPYHLFFILKKELQ